MSEFREGQTIRWSRHRRLGLAGVLVVAGVVLAACGGSSSGASSGAPAGASGSTAAATVETASGPQGTYLTDGSGRTLYVFAPDTGSTSTCNGQCASVWPPLVASGAATAAGDAKASLLGSSKRADGSMQVTYAGHPLYTYVADTAKGDVKGQGLNVDGGLWWIVAADGTSIQKAASSGSHSMSKAPGRY